MPHIVIPTSDTGMVRLAKDINIQYNAVPEGDPNPYGSGFISTLDDKKDELKDGVDAKDTARTEQKTAKEALEPLQGTIQQKSKHYFSNLDWLMRQGEAPASDWTRYGLNANNTRLPPLRTVAQLRDMSQKIIDAEAARRTVEGAVPITMPTQEAFALARTNFVAQADLFSNKKLAFDQAQDSLEAPRKQLREILRAAYRTLATFYRNQGMSMPDIRRIAREWGFTFRSSPNDPPEEE